MSDHDAPRIAIIGMAGRFPGAADLAELWRNLGGGIESISTFAPDQLEPGGAQRAARDPLYVPRRGVVEGAELFEPGFFGYTRRQAELTDPQQRLFLECAWEALEHAGYDPARYQELIGVFGGVGFNNYLIANLLANRSVVNESGVLQTSIRNRTDHLATNVAYHLNLRGPAVTVQTACSTSLVAVHLACQSLLNHECDLALAGGSSISVPQRAGYVYQEGGILSRDGSCRAFDAAASGTVSGDGAGVIVLKRLAEAIADRDTIHAVILGSAIGNDGSHKVGYTAPSVEGQARVLGEAYAMAGVELGSIGFIEAHGTGTPMGDPIEIAALNEVFAEVAGRPASCAIGSIKSNLGHLDAAAGVAGLIKAVLSVEHGELVPSLHFQRANPEVPFGGGPFFVNTERRPWPAGGPRRAGVSSFGIGGTNAHVVLEEAPAPSPSAASRPFQLLLLSARTSTALEAVTARLGEALLASPELELSDLAYTLQVGRAELAHRRMVVCRDRDEALRALTSLDPRLSRTGFHQAKERPVVFMFPGQGSQHVNMGRDLYLHEPTFRRALDECSQQLRPHLGAELTELLYPREGGEQEAGERLRQTEITQPALFAVEYALATLLLEWGLEPKAMVGHSIGEYVAACLAGVLSLSDALGLVATRGRLMQRLPAGAMLVVPMTELACVAMAEARGLSLAAVNGPESCVLSGPLDAIDRLEQELVEQGVACRRVATSHAFHSSMMDPVLAEFGSYCAGVTLRPPTRPYLSNLTGTWITAEQATDPDYWVRHLRETVRFADGVGALVADPDWVLLEVGPGRTLSTFARWNPTRATGQVVLNAMRHPGDVIDDGAFLLTSLGRLWMAGGKIDAGGFYRHEERRRIPLPTYPFERQRCWIDAAPVGDEPAVTASGLEKRSDMDGWFYAPSWRRTAAPAVAVGAGERWLILADRYGLAEAVAAELRARGARPVVVHAAHSGVSERSIRELEPSDYDRLLEELAAAGAAPERILYLWGITEVGGASAADPEKSFLAPLYLAQALGRRAERSPVDLVFVSNYLQDVTGGEVVAPERATLLGPCRVIPQEYAELGCRHLDLDFVAGGAPEARLVAALVAEASGATERSVAYRNGYRWVRSFESLPLPVPEAFHPRHHGVTLVTGGLGGIGLVLADALVLAGADRLVLIARRGLPPRAEWSGWLASHGADDETSRKIHAVERLEQRGAEVLVLAADVGDRAAMTAAVAEARARFGEVNGVIHAAGVAGGGIMALRTAEAARRVLTPKVAGALVLEELFADTPLDFFLLCSSRSSILGGLGQVDYCAANAFLDVFAASTRARGRNRAVSIDWDAWREVGMLVDQAAARGVQERRQPRPLDHALFDEYVRESADTESYLTTLCPLRHWILDEHRIVGNAVMPGTGYLEMARAATEASAGTSLIEIRDAFFLAPLGLRDDEERTVKTTIKRDADGYTFRVTSKPPDELEWKDYATGRVAFVDPQPPRRHDLAAIIERCNRRRVIMTDDTPRDEDLGPRWQALKVAYVGDDEHLARLELPEEFAGELESLKLHPSLLDRATGTGKEFLIKEGVYLPMGYRRLTIHRPLERIIYVHVRFRPEVDPTGQTITFDVVFMNEAGDELVDIEAFAQKRINDIAGQIRVFANRQYGRREATRAAASSATGALESVYAQQLQQGITAAEGVLAFRRVCASAAAVPQIVVSARDLHASIAQADQRRTAELGIEKRAVPATDATGTSAAPGNAEQDIAEVWRRVLGVDQVGVSDNFFDLGGDSIQAIQIVAQINALGYTLTAQQLFQHQTVAELASVLGGARVEPAAREAAEPVATSGNGDAALAPLPPRRTPAASDVVPVLVEAASSRTEPERKASDRPMEFGLFFFADSGGGTDKYHLYLNASRFADQHNFSAVWTPERHFHRKGGLYPNPSVLSSALAVTTRRIALRAGSVVMPLHNPLRVAEEWSIVDNLSHGRVGLAFVSGWVPNDFAFFPERYAVKREEMFRGIEQVRRLWRGESIQTLDGAGKMADIRIYPQPVQAELPTWLTCSGASEMFVTAGKLGFDILTSLQQQTMDALAENLGAYRRARAEAGFDPWTGKVAVMMHTFLGAEKEAVLHKVREPLSNYLRSHLDLIKSFTSSLDIEAGLDQPERIDTVVQFAFERYHRTASLIGTPRDCRAMIARLKAIGVSEVACLIDFGVDVESTLASLAYLDELRQQEWAQPAGARIASMQIEAS